MSATATTTDPAPTLVTDGQVITIADSTGRLLTCGLEGVAVCIAEPKSVENAASKTQWRVQLLKNGFFKLQSLHDGSLLMAERCYKDLNLTGPYITKIRNAIGQCPSFANTSALTTTLEYAKNPYGLYRGSGNPINGISDPVGFEQASQAAQTMWAYTKDGKMVCAYDFIWQSYCLTGGVVSEAAMRVDSMVSAGDLEIAAAISGGGKARTQLGQGLWYPLTPSLRTLTSIVWPQDKPALNPSFPNTFPSPGGLATAAWFGNMPPRWASDAFGCALKGADATSSGPNYPEADDSTLTAIEGTLCTKWTLNAVPSEQVLVGDLFCPIISSSFAPEVVHGIGNMRNTYHQVPAYMIKVQTNLRSGPTKTTGSTITYSINVADIPQNSSQRVVCNGVMNNLVPGIPIEVESEFATRELNISILSTGLAACPLAITYLALDGVRLESNAALTFMVDPSDAHSPKLSQLTGEHLIGMNPNANKDDCNRAAAAIQALHAAVANPIVGGQPVASPAHPMAIEAMVMNARIFNSDSVRDEFVNWGHKIRDKVIDPVIAGATDAANKLAAVATSEAWDVIHLAEKGEQAVVDTGKAFANDVMNGVKVLVEIGGKVAHYVAQGVQDVVAFARLVFQQLEIAVEKMEEFLKMWLDFQDFQVAHDCLSNFYTDIKDNMFLNRSFMIDPLRDYLKDKVHELEDEVDDVFDKVEKFLGVAEGQTAPDASNLLMKAFKVASSGLTWLLDKMMRLLPAGNLVTDLAGAEKILQDTFGAVLKKYKGAPDLTSVFDEVLDDLMAALGGFASGTAKAGFGQIMKALHTVAKGAFSAIEWSVEIMADLLYYGFKAVFEIMDLTVDMGMLRPLLQPFGIDIPKFSLMELVLWPQAVPLTLLLKASGVDTWNSFKSSNGHLLPFGANSRTTTGPAPHAMMSSSNHLSMAAAPRAMAFTAEAADGHTPVTDPQPVLQPVRPPQGSAYLGPEAVLQLAGWFNDDRRLAINVIAVIGDIGYGFYFFQDTKGLSLGAWGEGEYMWAGAIVKVMTTVISLYSHVKTYGPEDSLPITVYLGFVAAGAWSKIPIRLWAASPENVLLTPEPRELQAARKKALMVNSALQMARVIAYVSLSNTAVHNFDGITLGLQLTGLSYTVLQAYVAAKTLQTDAGVRTLSPAEMEVVWGCEAAINATQLGLGIVRAIKDKVT